MTWFLTKRTMKVTTSSPAKEQANPKVPRGLRSLPSMGASPDEHQLIQQDAQQIAKWWKEPRWKHTKRIYSRK